MWIRLRDAGATDAAQVRTSCSVARASPQIVGPVAAPHLFRHRLDRLRITGRGSGIARLDHVHPESGELVCYLELLVQVHRAAGRLFSVAQRGVEDADAIVVVARRSYSIGVSAHGSPSA